MKKIYLAVQHSALWQGVGFSDFESMIRCMEAKTRSYEKGDYVLMTGDVVRYIGVVVSGSVKIIHEAADGNDVILTELAAPELFGEVFACAGIERSPVTVQASEKSEVLFLDYRKVITTCSSACVFHAKLIENMLQLLAQKNLMLNQKIEILSKRTTREKLFAFFDTQRGTAGEFTVPYNREEMARYLCVDRSAMSQELGKMRDEGLIRFRKNTFTICANTQQSC